MLIKKKKKKLQESKNPLTVLDLFVECVFVLLPGIAERSGFISDYS